MGSCARVASFLAMASLVAAATWTWVGCSSADAPVDPGDAGVEASDGPAVETDAADAAPFVAAAHRPWPELLPHSGRLLKPLRLVSIVAQNDDLKPSLFAFGDALLTSSWWKTVGGEYGVGTVSSSLHVTGPAIMASPEHAGLIQYVADAIGDAGAPEANGNTLYLLYLPQGVSVAKSTFTSYHSEYPGADAGAGDGFAVVSRDIPSGGESQLDQITKAASHEIIEAATDPGLASWRIEYPNTKQPWTTSIWGALQYGTVENADLCAGTRTREPPANGFLYQRSWSLARAAAGDAAAGDPCVPARTDPFSNVSVPEDWYEGAAGTSVKIPFSGWSTAVTKNWVMDVVTGVVSRSALNTIGLGSGLTLKTSLGNSAITGCAKSQAMNNGETGTLTVDIPADAVSGDFIVLLLYSLTVVSKCAFDPEADLGHQWPVGVYVP